MHNLFKNSAKSAILSNFATAPQLTKRPRSAKIYSVMKKFDFDAKYFDPTAVLECGQVFRFHPFKEGYFVNSGELACYVYGDGVKTVVESENPDYFWRYFDLDRNYADIVDRAKSFNIPLLSYSAEKSKGLRLLNQNREETIYSFIISQNNNIPRIKGIISRICAGLGEKREFSGESYYTFPSSEKMANAGAEFYKNAGAGYRDVYLADTSARIAAEGLENLNNCDISRLKSQLLTYKGIGPKVADCVALFAFGNTGAFPVDTWVEKIYLEDFKGQPASREKIAKYFTDSFGEYSGYVQQYLFYAKRQNYNV